MSNIDNNFDNVLDINNNMQNAHSSFNELINEISKTINNMKNEDAIYGRTFDTPKNQMDDYLKKLEHDSISFENILRETKASEIQYKDIDNLLVQHMTND